ncbi:GroES-like protein [Daedaleopsis nitida]|nr:GroES-like protein [Daedaleopsis nitida]
MGDRRNRDPHPGPQDVLVKIFATALNPVDWKIQAYGYFITNYPFVPGTDAAGIVEEVGAEVTNVAKGDKVLFQGWFENPKATFQQYAIVPAEITAKIPENISFDQAASIPLGLATVFTGTWNKDPEAKSTDIPAPWEAGGETKFAGKPAFILGGSSSVGQYAIQLARLNKFSPIIATASLHNEALLKSLGATHVINRSLAPEAILSEVQKITGGTPIQYVYDAVSLADTQSIAYQALAPGGVLLLVLPDAIPEDLKADADGKKIVNVFGNIHTPSNRKIGVEVYKRLTQWLKDGLLVPNRVEVLPNGLAGIPDGLNRLKEDKVSGMKLIARPQETA